MNRYATSRIIKTPTNKSRLETTIVPVMPTSDTDTYIQTSSPERLDKLANTFYGTATLWWLIASVNGLGKGTLVVPANSVLRIPSMNNAQQIINNTNNAR
jgi:hypothetical protein